MHIWRCRWELEHIHSERRNATNAIRPQVLDVMLTENVARAKLPPVQVNNLIFDLDGHALLPPQSSSPRPRWSMCAASGSRLNRRLTEPIISVGSIPMEWLARKRTWFLSDSECHPDRQQTDACQGSTEDNDDTGTPSHPMPARRTGRRTTMLPARMPSPALGEMSSAGRRLPAPGGHQPLRHDED